MSDVFVVRNQLGHYWGKGKHWVDGSEPRTVMRSPHRDEALNTLIELGSKDIELRGEIVQVPLNDRGEPAVEPSDIPLPDAGQPALDLAAGDGSAIEAGAAEPESASPA